MGNNKSKTTVGDHGEAMFLTGAVHVKTIKELLDESDPHEFCIFIGNVCDGTFLTTHTYYTGIDIKDIFHRTTAYCELTESRIAIMGGNDPKIYDIYFIAPITSGHLFGNAEIQKHYNHTPVECDP